jgi:hypothetical protein
MDNWRGNADQAPASPFPDFFCKKLKKLSKIRKYRLPNINTKNRIIFKESLT